jgi:hypothetical protein
VHIGSCGWTTLRRLTRLVTVALLPATATAAQSAAGSTEIKGTVVFGTAQEIGEAGKTLGTPVSIVPADRIRGRTELYLPPEVIERYRLFQDANDGRRRPFVVFVPGQSPQTVEEVFKPYLTEAPQMAFQLGVSPLRPGDICPQCLPVAPGQPGAIPPLLLPQLSNREAAFSLPRCGSAATALRLRAQSQPDCFRSWTIHASSCSAPVAAAAHFAEYVEACTTPAAGINETDLRQLAVITRAGETRPFCMALLVSPSLAITAAHCFTDVPVSAARLRAWSDRDAEIDVEFQGDPNSLPASQLGERAVVLKLKTPARNASDNVCFGDPGRGAPLQLYGYLAPPGETVDAQSDWTKSVRTGAYTCSAVSTPSAALESAITHGRCYRHSCQAFGGFSGAPIFGTSAPNGCGTAVLGMHVAAAGPSGSSCSGAATNSALTGSFLSEALTAAVAMSKALETVK